MTSKKKQFIFDTIDEYFEGFEDWAEQLQERLAQRHSWNQRACTIEPLRHMEITPLEVKITVDLPHTEEKNVKITQMNEKTIEISAKISGHESAPNRYVLVLLDLSCQYSHQRGRLDENSPQLAHLRWDVDQIVVKVSDLVAVQRQIYSHLRHCILPIGNVQRNFSSP